MISNKTSTYLLLEGVALTGIKFGVRRKIINDNEVLIEQNKIHKPLKLPSNPKSVNSVCWGGYNVHQNQFAYVDNECISRINQFLLYLSKFGTLGFEEEKTCQTAA